MTATANAVNFTDGLDGLAIMPVVMVGSALGVFAYVVGNSVYSKYLLFPHIPGAGELLIFCAAMAGAGLAFLWFNAHPAQVFMGDTGSLALGGALGAIAVATKHEIVLAIVGGLFVAEGDLVVVHATMSGEHTGTFVSYGADGRPTQAFPPTGKRFASTQSHWFRVADGKVIEHWANRDDLGTATQLGWTPPSPLYIVRMLLATRKARREAR